MKQSNYITVFLTDDDAFCLNMYQQFLAELDFITIRLFSNGADCLNEIDILPDVVFLDYYMPGINGIDVLKKIKELSPETYVVMVSNQQDINTLVTSLNAGAFDFVIKDANVGHRLKNIVTKIYLLKDEKKSRGFPGHFKSDFFN